MQAVLHVSEREIRQGVDGFAFEGIDGAGVFFGVLESGVEAEKERPEYIGILVWIMRHPKLLDFPHREDVFLDLPAVNFDNYAIGSAQIAAIRNNPDEASSYPAIDPVNVDMSQYSTIIIGAPLWWSNMAAPVQTFLFQHGKDMAGKNIGLIVSSASSGISGVESDAKRLIPDGKFLSPSLWIRSYQTSDANTLFRAGCKPLTTTICHPL